MKIIRPKSSYKRDLKLSFSLWGQKILSYGVVSQGFA